MSNALSLQINEKTGDYTVTYHGFSWVSDGRRPYILLRKKAGKRFLTTYRPLYAAKKKEIIRAEKQIVTRLSGYMAFGKTLPFTLVLTAEITGENEVRFSVKAENETGVDIQMVALGSTKGVFVGHDHMNNYTVNYQGIQLSYGLSCDHNIYVVPFRGGNLINIKEDGSFTTQALIRHRGQSSITVCKER